MQVMIGYPWSVLSCFDFVQDFGNCFVFYYFVEVFEYRDCHFCFKFKVSSCFNHPARWAPLQRMGNVVVIAITDFAGSVALFHSIFL